MKKIVMTTLLGMATIFGGQINDSQAQLFNQTTQLAQPLEVIEGKIIEASGENIMIHREGDLFFKNIIFKINSQTKIADDMSWTELQKGDLVKIAFYEEGENDIASRITRIAAEVEP